MEIINGTSVSILQSSSDVVCCFSEKLNFCELYNFIKSQKLFIYNKNISHTSCLCDTWENNALLAKGLDICKKDSLIVFPKHLMTFPEIQFLLWKKDQKDCI